MAITISRSGGNIYDAASLILAQRAAAGGGGGGGGGGGSSGGSGGSGGSGSSGGSGLTQDERDALKRQQKLEDDARKRQQELEDDARTRQQKLEDAAQKREDDARKQEAEDKAYAKKYGDDALREAQEQRYKAEDDARQQAAEDKAYAKKYGDDALRDAQEQKYKIEDDERKREDEALKRKYKEADDALKREDEALAQKKKREDAAQEQKYKIEDDARAQASKDREYAQKYGNEALADAQKQRYKIADDARKQADQEKNTAADQANQAANSAQDQQNSERNAAIDSWNKAQQAAMAAANSSALASQRAGGNAANAAQRQMYDRENALRQQGYRSWNDRQQNQFTLERDRKKEEDRVKREERAQKYKIEILGIKDEKQQLNATQRASLKAYEKWQDRIDDAYDNGFVFTPEQEKALLEEEIAFNQEMEDPQYDESTKQAMRKEFERKRAAKVPTIRVTTPAGSRMIENGITYVHKNGNWEIEEDPNVALADKTRLRGQKDRENRRKQANERQDAIDKAEEFYRSRTQLDNDTKPLYTEDFVQRLARKKVKESEKERFPDLPPLDGPTTPPGPVVQPQPPVDPTVPPVDPTITPPTRVREMGAWKDLNDDNNGVTKDGITYEQWQAMRDDPAAIARWEAGGNPFEQATQQPPATGLNQPLAQSGLQLPDTAGANGQQQPSGGTTVGFGPWTGNSSGQTTGPGQGPPITPPENNHNTNYLDNVQPGQGPQSQPTTQTQQSGVSPIDVDEPTPITPATGAMGPGSTQTQTTTITPSSTNIGDYFKTATDSGDTEGAAAFQTIQSISAKGIIPPEGSDDDEALSKAYRVLVSRGLKIGAKNH